MRAPLKITALAVAATLLCSAEAGAKLDPLPKKIKGQVTRALSTRGFEVKQVLPCRKKGPAKYRCEWRVTGSYADGPDYSCSGFATYYPKRPARRLRLDRCLNGELWDLLTEAGLHPTAILNPKVEGGVYKYEWRAEGVGDGGVPYRCKDVAKYDRATNKWTLGQCASELEPQIPLLSQPGPHPAFGYSGTHLYNLSQSWYDLVERSGSDVSRQGLAWSVVESAKGTYNWQVFDAVYQNLTKRGIRPLWILTLAPCWAQPSGANCSGGGLGVMHPSESNYDEFAKFAAEAAKRYPQSAGFEVWNEPNFDRFWGGEADVDTYIKMFKEVAPAIHAANPEMPVYTGGLSPHSNPTPDAIPYQDFIDAMYRGGAAQLADAVAIHPYPSTPFTANPENGGYIERIRVHMERVDRVMRQHGDGSTPIAVTEVGVSTDSSDTYTPEQQAKALVDIYQLFRHIDGVPIVIVHSLADTPSAGGDEAGFGVVTESGNPKDAFCALAAVRGNPC